jgi:DNA-binding NarL/FixJ family response regulator
VPYKILIVDDHSLVREGLALLVSTLPGGASIFTAETAAQALEQAELHAPLDAVLLDCGLPDASGINLIRALQARCGHAPVIVVSADETDSVESRVLQMGASAFVPKSKASANVLNALKLALAHGLPASTGPAVATEAQPTSSVPVLTARQLDILLMLDQGQTNHAIALQLGLAEKTVKNHITGLFSALGAVNRLQAIRQARNTGLLK